MAESDRNDGDFADDFCNKLSGEISITPDCSIKAGDGISVRKRGNLIFVMNFADGEAKATLDREYTDVANGKALSGEITLPVCGYLVLK